MKHSPEGALAASAAALRRLVDAYPAAAFEGRLATDGWTGRDHIAHIARYQIVFLDRIERIRAETNVALPRYRGDEDPGFPRYRALPLGALIDEMERERHIVRTALATLDDATLDRIGVHPVFGGLTLRRWVDFMIAHEGHHYYQVMRCVANSSTPVSGRV